MKTIIKEAKETRHDVNIILNAQVHHIGNDNYWGICTNKKLYSYLFKEVNDLFSYRFYYKDFNLLWEQTIKKYNNKYCSKCKGDCCSACSHHYGYFMNNSKIEIDNCKFVNTNDIFSTHINITTDIENILAKYHNENFTINLKKYAYMIKEYSTDRGFLSNTGCTLPRYLRSMTCLNHMCDRMEEALGDQMFILRHSLYILKALKIKQGIPF